MTASLPAVPPDRGVGRRVLDLLGTMLVFVLLGPLAGGVVTIVGLVVFGMDLDNAGDAGMVILAMFLYGLWMAYPIGAIPAAIVGATVGFMDAFRGGTSLALATGLGLASGVCWSVVLDGADDAETGLFRFLVIFASVAATLTCWKATRWRRAG